MKTRKERLRLKMEFLFENSKANAEKILNLQSQIKLLNDDIRSDQRAIRNAQIEMSEIETQEFEQKAVRGAAMVAGGTK